MIFTNYWWLTIWILLGGLMLNYAFPKVSTHSSQEGETRWHWISAYMLTFPLILGCMFRKDWVGDTAAYKYAFENSPVNLNDISGYISTVSKDKGFYLITALIHNITNNTALFFFIIALFQIGIITWLYKKYSSDYWFSIMLFVLSTDYISWAQNGIRQFMAITICLLATPFVLKDKKIPALILILIASTMHQSALIMIPIFLIAIGKPWNIRTLAFTALVIVAVLSVDRFTDILDTAMQETQYANMITDWKAWNDDGTNPIRVLVYSIPTIIAIWGRRYISPNSSKLIDLCINMSVVTSAIYVLSMLTSGIFIGRLPAYASFYNYILLPWEIDQIFVKNSAKIVKIVAIGFYFAFFYYQMHTGWSLI